MGLDIYKYEPYYKLIDERLLKNRNEIAHGEYLNIDIKLIDELHNEVVKIMRWFKDDIENYASEKKYLSIITTHQI